MNLSENHKRVSDEPELTSMVDQSMQTVSILFYFPPVYIWFAHCLIALLLRSSSSEVITPIIDYHYE